MVYVKGYYSKPSVLIAKGFALFTPIPSEVILGNEKISLLHFAKRVNIPNGYFDVDLQATDDTGISSETWRYFVQVFIKGMKPVSFELNVPEASSSSGIDLGNVSPEEDSSGSLELGETSGTAYRGDRGKTAYDHTSLTNNPHSVTKTQVGLGSVDNTSDSEKPVSTSTQSALDLKADLVAGTVPSEQLPSYVDDVLEVANFAALPGTGATGKIYVTLDDNKTFRWSGSVYVEISASLALGETSASAYRGDRGKTAYDHSQLTSGNPHSVTKSDVGLGSVDNTADTAKPVSTAQQTALNLKANSSALAALAFLATVSTSQIDNDAVTYAKIQNVTTARLLGRNTAGSGDVEELDASTSRSLLGLGTAAVQNTGAFDTSGAAATAQTAAQTYADTLFASVLAFTTSAVNYVLAATDHLKQVEFTKATAGTITIPLNATVAIPVGFTTVCRQVGAGQITVTPESGSVTLQAPGSKLKTNVQFSYFTAVKVATDTWAISGDLIA